MKWRWLTCLCLICALACMLAMPAAAAEMSNGNYAVMVSAVSIGGGRSQAGIAKLWGSVLPTAAGKSTSGMTELFAGVFTPLIPEPAALGGLAFAVWLTARKRRG